MGPPSRSPQAARHCNPRHRSRDSVRAYSLLQYGSDAGTMPTFHTVLRHTNKVSPLRRGAPHPTASMQGQ